LFIAFNGKSSVEKGWGQKERERERERGKGRNEARRRETYIHAMKDTTNDMNDRRKS